MKKLICSLLFIYALASCNSERIKTLNSIDGSWTITNIVYSKGIKPDSASMPFLSSITFDKCSKSSNQGGPGNCTGRYTIGNRSYEFHYQVLEDKKFTIRIRGQADESFDWTSFEKVARQYSVVSVSDNTLIFEGNNSENGYQTLRFVTKK